MIINIEKLKELCNKFTVIVSFNGFVPFTHKVIDANNLLEEIHLCSDVTKEEFITTINSGNYICEEVKSIFYNIQHQGMFKIQGYEKLGNHSYIERKELKWL